MYQSIEMMERRHFSFSASRFTLVFIIIFVLSLCYPSAKGQNSHSARTQVLEHPLRKILVQVGQVDGNPFAVGNGFIVDREGCYVLTNFHVAFGKGKTLSGETELVEEIAVGHAVTVNADLNPETGLFNRTLRGRVADFGNYKNNRHGWRNDLAMVRLDSCLGKGYGELTRLEVPEGGEQGPQTLIATLSLQKVAETRSALFLQERCLAGSDPSVAGLFFQTCEAVPGMSGSPIFRENGDRSYTIVGVTTGIFEPEGKPKLPYAIFSSSMTPFVQTVLRGEFGRR